MVLSLLPLLLAAQCLLVLRALHSAFQLALLSPRVLLDSERLDVVVQDMQLALGFHFLRIVS